MFVAWRDLRFAKGRFALMGSVVVLITLLVGLLSGLTAGLARENTSAVTGLDADHLAFAAPPDGQTESFADSTVREDDWRAWAARPGVAAAQPVGIRTLNATAGERSAAVSAFGVEPDGTLGPDGIGPGRVVLSEEAAEELGAAAGDRIALGRTEREVAAVATDASYSHTPVVWTTLDDWQQIGHDGAGPAEQATVIALTTTGGVDLAAGDEAAGTSTLTLDDSLTAIGSYQAENGSLQLMRGFLFAISALVIGAFFTVWTIQRSGDVAVLKALGASTPYLLRDALGQAVVMLVLGTGLGAALAAGAGALIGGGAVPFVLDPATVLVPAAVMIALGALGAALSVRRITAVDPLTALGSAR
ncbi:MULTISPECIES: ABC transporter permease [unclassified Streptomyces]|uniref:ABC transporter permease n=1 Tax=unclassified Streptomyces TaxID=2593676 RepID=UPI000805E6DB|nr:MULTISPECIES: ABC transporter permease [unclassified Streptomyces]NUV70506.1 ABC transporter permease [Streptomyces sp. CAI-121]NUV99704.1 ABC transporter permease [Streptomyces sp. CAI 127]NUW16664.1 ABC transporter permease [Streptomyces sp. CAI-68]SBV05552.1 putative ABC transport system permease protein [Streptomyces sp. Ncost-T6T-1]